MWRVTLPAECVGEEGLGSTAVETAVAPSSAEVAVYEGDTPFFPVGLCTTVYLPLAAAAGEPRPGADEMIIVDSNETTQGRVSYRFSGHQTFAFRYGWLEKGVRGVERRATIFSDEDALVHLGVGKNMVQSIRHWCTVTQLIEPVPGAPRGKAQPLQPTRMARLLLLPEGWDPFLEDDASLWLIHWMLVSNPSVCTTWQVLFCDYHRPDFTRREAVDHLASVAEKEALKVARSSLSRDFDCFLRTYAAPRAEIGEALPEESFDCPLLSLRLIQPSADGDLYAFGIGPKPSLPAPVFAFALDQHFNRTRETRSTLGIQQCLYGKGSPGQAFKLDENSLIEYIEELEELTDGAVSVDETAGLKQIYRRREFDALGLLDRYFGAGNGS